MSLPQMNHTQISNAFIDVWMRKIKSDCTPVFISIARKTIGWRKELDRIPQSQIRDLTGLDIRRVRQAIRILEENHLITISKTGKGRAQEWTYGINYDLIEENNGSKTVPIPEKNGSESDPFISTKTDPLTQNNGSKTVPSKEIILKEKDKEIYDLWNSLDPLMKHRDVSKHSKAITASQKTYSSEEVQWSIRAYATILSNPSEFWFTHKYDLSSFLKRGIERFLEINKPFDSLKKSSVALPKLSQNQIEHQRAMAKIQRGEM